MRNRLNTTVSFYRCNTDTHPTEAELHLLLTCDTYKSQVLAIRKERNPERQKALKNKLPCFTPSGLFTASDAKSLLQPTGLICIDIDREGNDRLKSPTRLKSFDRLKELITAVPYVMYCGLSVRGKGYFCIIPIAHPEKLKQHFRSLQEDFARCGVTIDGSCSDISRKRYVSYDPEPYINLNAKTYVYGLTPQRARKRGKNRVKPSSTTGKEVEGIISVIVANEIDITGSYNQWWEIGCALANEFGESGRDMFHAVSQFGDYDEEITDKKFDDALKGYDFSIGTFFHYAKQYGVGAVMDFREYLSKTKKKRSNGST